MKTYSAPTLVAVGRVIELTQGSFMGSSDSGETHQLRAAGSVGFSL
ncbi:MAG: lasso RiPP family leader peptide-containing protein [Gemmatimonadaceae bacterium]